jgi:hypothetical protein
MAYNRQEGKGSYQGRPDHLEVEQVPGVCTEERAPFGQLEYRLKSASMVQWLQCFTTPGASNPCLTGLVLRGGDVVADSETLYNGTGCP